MHRCEQIINDLAKNGYNGKDLRGLLSALICCCMPYADADKLAENLCAENKCLSSIVDIPKNKLVNYYGLDDATAVLINNIPDVVDAYRRKNVGQIISNTGRAREYFKDILSCTRVETLAACFLDQDLQVVSFDIINTGNIRSVAAKPMNIVRAAAQAHCKLALVAHNHPFSSAEPSDKDVFVTNSVRLIFSYIGIRLLDHIIVSGSGETYSMKTGGYVSIV